MTATTNKKNAQRIASEYNTTLDQTDYLFLVRVIDETRDICCIDVYNAETLEYISTL